MAILKEVLRTTKYLEEVDVKKLLAVITSVRDKALFSIAYYHGLRASEVGMLLEKDYDGNTPQLLIHRLKNGRERWHKLSDQENKLLRAWFKVRGKHGSDSPIFLSRRGTAISRRSLDYLMKEYGELAGIPTDRQHFHVLRHSCATAMVNADLAMVKIRDWLGHVAIQNTMIYANVSEKGMLDIAEQWEKHNSVVRREVAKYLQSELSPAVKVKVKVNWSKDKIKGSKS